MFFKSSWLFDYLAPTPHYFYRKMKCVCRSYSLNKLNPTIWDSWWNSCNNWNSLVWISVFFNSYWFLVVTSVIVLTILIVGLGYLLALFIRMLSRRNDLWLDRHIYIITVYYCISHICYYFRSKLIYRVMWYFSIRTSVCWKISLTFVSWLRPVLLLPGFTFASFLDVSTLMFFHRWFW